MPIAKEFAMYVFCNHHMVLSTQLWTYGEILSQIGAQIHVAKSTFERDLNRDEKRERQIHSSSCCEFKRG